MDVVHRVHHDSPDLFEALIGPQGRDGVALDEHVAVGEQLDGLQGRAVGADETLTAFYEALFVADQPVDLDHVRRDVVLENTGGVVSNISASVLQGESIILVLYKSALLYRV